MDNKLFTVTSPLLPNLEYFTAELQKIWDSKWITNMGQYHQQLENALAEYLHVPYVCLFTNGTLPLMTALQALRITGEVITTPYSFVATTHSIWWNNCKPVFVDIDPATGNIDPDKIEASRLLQRQLCLFTVMANLVTPNAFSRLLISTDLRLFTMLHMHLVLKFLLRSMIFLHMTRKDLPVS